MGDADGLLVAPGAAPGGGSSRKYSEPATTTIVENTSTATASRNGSALFCGRPVGDGGISFGTAEFCQPTMPGSSSGGLGAPPSLTRNFTIC